MTHKLRALTTWAPFIAVVLALSGCSYADIQPAPTSTAPAAIGALDRRLGLFMDQGAVAGVVQVRWPGGEWSKADGVRDLDSKAPAQPTDRVQVADVTTSMTAVTVLKLVDDALIGLDDPVNSIIPGFTSALRPPAPIAVRQLLGHTSGMPAFNEALFKDVDIRSAISEQVTPERALQLAGSLPWDPASVGSFTYSDTDYMALALLVETLRHKAFAQVLREEIIDPLGLTDTSTQNLDLNDARVLHGYITLHGQRLDVTDNTWTVDSPAAGVTSTVADVNSFYAALFQGKLISAKSLAELKKRPSLAPYALGVWTWPDGCTAGTRFEGRGALWAYLTLAVSSEDGRYVAAMTLVAPPLPTQVEDPGSEARRDLWLSHMESALNETLDRLCQHPD